MVKGYRLCEKPDPEFYKMMRELSAIGNRINQLAVKANADIIIIDPEREYSPLVKAMQGEVIHISVTSENHINAMDMNSDYGDGANPVMQKLRCSCRIVRDGTK